MQIKSAVNKNIGDTSGAIDKTFAKSTLYLNKIVSLDESRGLNIFDENIDFSLGTTVPDPLPFGDKLRNLLEAHGEFILTTREHEIGQKILKQVGRVSTLRRSGNRLDTEQEREQEQEQEKEVKARRDQQIEVEKFVDREYSRSEEIPNPWRFSILKKSWENSIDGNSLHPFRSLKTFHLSSQQPLPFPSSLGISTGYFNPKWTGLRRLKNVVIVPEWVLQRSKLSTLTDEDMPGTSKTNSKK